MTVVRWPVTWWVRVFGKPIYRSIETGKPTAYLYRQTIYFLYEGPLP